ncbi:myosin-IIIb-like [Stylophora pistillata]|uniref:myosin-IIIb-like n=1 Tax=Stylophora pistillata TaxID=50429 RepID=UPI000C0401AC|nr:myosin-IIIb-like [Stylophora pistillata]
MAVNEGDDLAPLEPKTVNDGAIVELLRRRYNHHQIYTSVADILLSVNPFKDLSIYGPKVIKAYQDSQPSSQLSPHVYSKSKAIVRSMHHSSKSQCCVLTGDSASGKTESLKHILDYVVSVSSPTGASMKAKFSKVHFILEAFGNAVTAQNRNSSRFAMYYELYFSPEMKLSGGSSTENIFMISEYFTGKVHHYMLEKSRVVHQEKGAKNFHVFHYLLYGLDIDEQQEYNLNAEYPHRYLSYDPSAVPPEDKTSKEILGKKYMELLKCMESVGFTKEEILNILKCLAAILHIGNIAFSSANPQTNSAFVKDPQPVKCASSLLGMSEDDMGESLIKGITYRKGEKFSVHKSVNLAN